MYIKKVHNPHIRILSTVKLHNKISVPWEDKQMINFFNVKIGYLPSIKKAYWSKPGIWWTHIERGKVASSYLSFGKWKICSMCSLKNNDNKKWSTKNSIWKMKFCSAMCSVRRKWKKKTLKNYERNRKTRVTGERRKDIKWKEREKVTEPQGQVRHTQPRLAMTCLLLLARLYTLLMLT